MRVALFYFMFIATNGLVLPYFPKYLDALGFSKTEIGRVNSINSVLLIFVPLIWGFLADKTNRTALLLKIACFGAAVVLAIFAWGEVRTYSGVLLICLGYYFFQTPMLPLGDSLAIVEARRIGTDYARLRLWGSISFIIVSFGFGQYLSRGGDIRWVPYVAALLAGLAAICVHALRQYGTGPHRTPPSFKDARQLLHDPGLMWFFVANAVHTAALSPYYLFYSIHLSKIGLGQDIVGWSFGLGVAAEVTMFWFARQLFDRRPLFPLMAFSFVLSTLRWLLVAYVSNGACMAMVQMAHAFTFALCYAGSVAHLEKNVAEPLRATGRALFAAISMGLAGVIGHNLAGFVCDRYDTSVSFVVAAALDIVALVPLYIAARYAAKRFNEPETMTGEELREVPPAAVE